MDGVKDKALQCVNPAAIHVEPEGDSLAKVTFQVLRCQCDQLYFLTLSTYGFCEEPCMLEKTFLLVAMIHCLAS